MVPSQWVTLLSCLCQIYDCDSLEKVTESLFFPRAEKSWGIFCQVREIQNSQSHLYCCVVGSGDWGGGGGCCWFHTFVYNFTVPSVSKETSFLLNTTKVLVRLGHWKSEFM